MRHLLMSVAIAIAIPAAAQEPETMAAYRASAKAASVPVLTAQYGPDAMRAGQLRLPKGKGPFPVAVVIHGGCWTKGFDTMTGIAGLADALTKRGMATWTIEYRMIGDPGAGWPGTFEDVANGVDYLTVLAKKYPLDLKRVTVVGHSAGAHLALWDATRAKLGGKWAPKIRPVSVVAIDGPGALTPFVGADAQVCGKPVIAPLMGGTPSEKPAEYKLASPSDQLPLGVKQLLVPAALAFTMTPYAEAAKAAGDKVEVLPAGNDHFDIITPGTPNGDKVIDFIATRAFAR